jgi:hypothetical protein
LRAHNLFGQNLFGTLDFGIGRRQMSRGIQFGDPDPKLLGVGTHEASAMQALGQNGPVTFFYGLNEVFPNLDFTCHVSNGQATRLSGLGQSTSYNNRICSQKTKRLGGLRLLFWLVHAPPYLGLELFF